MYIHEILNSYEIISYLRNNLNRIEDQIFNMSWKLFEVENENDYLKLFNKFDYYFFIKSKQLKDYKNPQLFINSIHWLSEKEIENTFKSLIAGDVFNFNLYKPSVTADVCPIGYNFLKWLYKALDSYEPTMDDFLKDEIIIEKYYVKKTYHQNLESDEFIVDSSDAEKAGDGFFSTFHRGLLVITNQRILYTDLSDYKGDYSFEINFNKYLNIYEKKEMLENYLVISSGNATYKLLTSITSQKVNEYKTELFS